VCPRDDVAPYAGRRKLGKCSGVSCRVVSCAACPCLALAATRCLSMLINANRFPVASRCFLCLPVASRCVPAASRCFPCAPRARISANLCVWTPGFVGHAPRLRWSRSRPNLCYFMLIYASGPPASLVTLRLLC
jgi:hypothetical protein